MFQIGMMPSAFIPRSVVVDCKDSGDPGLYPVYGHVVGSAAYADINRSGHVFPIQTVEEEQANCVNRSLCDICFVGLRPAGHEVPKPVLLGLSVTMKRLFRKCVCTPDFAVIPFFVNENDVVLSCGLVSQPV